MKKSFHAFGDHYLFVFSIQKKVKRLALRGTSLGPMETYELCFFLLYFPLLTLVHFINTNFFILIKMYLCVCMNRNDNKKNYLNDFYLLIYEILYG